MKSPETFPARPAEGGLPPKRPRRASLGVGQRVSRRFWENAIDQPSLAPGAGAETTAHGIRGVRA